MGKRKTRSKKPAPPKKWQPMRNATFTGPEEVRQLLEAEPSFVGVFLNDLYQVTMKEIGEKTKYVSLAIIRRDRKPIHDWRHFQQIKNDLCGKEREAIELYPAESRLVDTNNQYHLFVFPEGATVPFGYTEREVSDIVEGTDHCQRPFADPPEDLNESIRDRTRNPWGSVMVPPHLGDGVDIMREDRVRYVSKDGVEVIGVVQSFGPPTARIELDNGSILHVGAEKLEKID